jgi:phosphoribosylanthranilate isomerase
VSAPKIKFCGVTREQDADLAVSLGAWAVGLILWPQSPRAVTLDQAAGLAAGLKRRAEIVGVFVNPALDELTRTADTVGLTIIQLHGEEGPTFCIEAARRTGCKIIKAVRVQGRADIQALGRFHTDYHLVDSYKPGVPGGTGETFAWELAAGHRRLAPPKGKGQRVPLILSGGLTPENVAAGIEAVRPWAVDVSSGVESAPGVKDAAKMRAFAAAVAETAAVAAAAADTTTVAAGADAEAGTPSFSTQDDNENDYRYHLGFQGHAPTAATADVPGEVPDHLGIHPSETAA